MLKAEVPLKEELRIHTCKNKHHRLYQNKLEFRSLNAFISPQTPNSNMTTFIQTHEKAAISKSSSIASESLSIQQYQRQPSNRGS